MPSRIRIPIKELLKFYDDPDRTHQGHTTAITSVIGEDLGTGLLIDYYHRRGLEARVLDGIVTQGTKKGKRLDRWIVVKHGKHSTYYQVEIKNWGASAIGGQRIELDAGASKLRKHKIERWSKEWDGKGFIKEGVQKVLIPMKSPEPGVSVEPLVCFWNAMHRTGADAPLFFMPTDSKIFPRVWVFSMSSHLRNLSKSGELVIEFEAPAIKARLKLLRELITK